MEKLFDNLSSYNLLNNLIPGSIFCYLLHHICAVDILNSNVVENLFIYYFVGMVISRVGSVVLEPIVKKTGIVVYADPDDYVVASKLDNKIDILLETNNLYRTIATSGLLIIVVKVYILVEHNVGIPHDASQYGVAVLLMIIFLLAFRKQTAHIKKRVDRAVKDNGMESKK